MLTPSSEPWIQVEDVSTAKRQPGGAEVMESLDHFQCLQKFDAVAMLSGIPTVAAGVVLQETQLATSDGHWSGGPATLVHPSWRQDEFLDAVTKVMINLCDGQRTVTQVIDDAAAQLQSDPDEVLAIGLFRLRELVGRGFLHLARGH